MQRRTFIQGAAVTVAAAPFAPILAQDNRPAKDDQPGTTILRTRNQALLEAFRSQKDFDILRLDPKQFTEYGLPQIDRNSPLYEDVWKRILSAPLRIEEAEPAPGTIESLTNPRFLLPPGPVVSTRFETSRNWSGAYIEADNGRIFTELSGTWTIPKFRRPAGAAAQNAENMVCSIWIGLDGQRRYRSSSLPQIGTRQGYEFNPITQTSEPVCYAWYQWWAPGQISTVPVKIADLNVDDTVVCDLQVTSPTTVTISIIKLGTPMVFWPITLPLIDPIPLPLPGATAEWVVERPTALGSDVLLPLPVFDVDRPVRFSRCFAAAQELAPFSGPAVIYRQLEGARFIQMFERLHNPARTRKISMPGHSHPYSRDAFQVVYTGPN